jgi:phage terminase small subunit
VAPLPTSERLRRLRGFPDKRPPRREVAVEPLPAVPEPPPFLSGHAAQMFKRLGADLVALRLLSAVDLNTLAAYCAAFGRWRAAQEVLARREDPRVLRASREEAREMHRHAARLGIVGAVRLGDPEPSACRRAGRAAAETA